MNEAEEGGGASQMAHHRCWFHLHRRCFVLGPPTIFPPSQAHFAIKCLGEGGTVFFAGGEEEERKSYLLFALCISGLLARKKNAWDIWEGKKKYLFSWLIFDGVAIPVNNNGVKETKKIIVIFLVSHNLKTFYYFVILDPLKFFSSNSVFLSLFLTFAILDLLKLYSRNSLFLSRDCSNQPRHNKNRLLKDMRQDNHREQRDLLKYNFGMCGAPDTDLIIAL